MYVVLLSNKAEKQLSKLPSEARRRVVTALRRLRRGPRGAARKLRDSELYRLRVGDYRIVFEVEDEKLIVYVIKVHHRRNAYKR